jgi:exopolysaccharide biosynthesis protein
MRINFFSFLFITVIFFSCQVLQLDENQKQIKKAPWESQQIAEGAFWKYNHFENIFNSKQSITVLDIDLDNPNLMVKIPHIEFSFRKTSSFGKDEQAFAAINGSYFNTKTGGSVVFFSKEGEVIKRTIEGFPRYRDNAGFAIDSAGNVAIVKKPEEGWEAYTNPYTLLSSGPLLLYEGDTVSQVVEKFNTNRHPRTAVGITNDNRLIAVVVDGRSSEAYGMTIKELATLMQGLGCTEAMNLDEGGSSTAWVKGQPFDGVANYPSDNKSFDHAGQRAVANAIVFKIKNHVVQRN